MMVIGRPVTWAAAGRDTNALSNSVHAAIAGRRQRDNKAEVATWRDGILLLLHQRSLLRRCFMGAPRFK
jgi:hypothetical protein